MKMAKQFPTFKSHETVSCFNCDGDFGAGYYCDSGNVEGYGKWAQDCSKCGFRTYYDVEKNEKDIPLGLIRNVMFGF